MPVFNHGGLLEKSICVDVTACLDRVKPSSSPPGSLLSVGVGSGLPQSFSGIPV